MEMLSLVILLVLFAVFLVMGVPIAVAMTLSAIIPMFITLPAEMVLITTAQQVILGMNKYSLIAIPLFCFSGAIMSEAGLALRLINFAKIFVGGIPGSLLHINIVANMLFGALSGSSVAAASSMGKVLNPIEKEDGYDSALSAAANIASGPTGFLIPPNTGAIIFATLSGGAASVTAIFMAGYIPGLMLGISSILISYYYAKKNGYKTSPRMSFKESVKVTWDALPIIFLMFGIVGGILFGIFTPSEASAMSSFYSLVMALAYKGLNKEKMIKIIKDTANITATILYLIACSYIFSWFLAYQQIPATIAKGILSFSTDPNIVLLLVCLILFLMGMVMDVSPITTIFTPIFVPIIIQIGVHPVHFAILMTLCSAMGVCTPPVGNLLYLGASIAETKVEKVLKYLWPMVLGMIGIVILNVIFPEISLFVPRAVGLL